MKIPQEPTIRVGIVHATEIKLTLQGRFLLNGGAIESTEVTARYTDGGIEMAGTHHAQILLSPMQAEDWFEIAEVTIGIDFHWQRNERQRFRGALEIIIDEEGLVAINHIGIEEYLKSVISSEMSATASVALLEAHAIISRSWLLAQLAEREHRTNASQPLATNGEILKWWDREDHALYDVCADDHCQRYQGITRASTPEVTQAVDSTRGILLTYQGSVCDARFSKCCGGITEEYQACWDETPHPYLYSVADTPGGAVDAAPFCATTEAKIIAQVLNGYDRETTHFYRWEVRYTQEELRTLIEQKTGRTVGDIIDLVPLQRGVSGRIIKLRIVGSNASLVIGKELMIRRTLSVSHLYSSAFEIEKSDYAETLPGAFVLRGKGWGHGVGLCQIGAAVMGEKGYTSKEILVHYFPHAELKKEY